MCFIYLHQEHIDLLQFAPADVVAIAPLRLCITASRHGHKNNLRERAQSERTGTVCSAIVEMIRGKQFLLSEPDISGLAKRGDEIIDGWIFAYRLCGLPPQERNDLLRTNIKSENPRIREQVCDIIGDEFIEELREPLLELIDDPVDYVSNAARYNHDEMFNAYQGVCSDPPPRCAGGQHSSAL